MAQVQFIQAEEAFNQTVRGWVFFPFQAEVVPFNLVDGTTFHIVKTEPGEIRGNHLHPGVEEYLHVFGGRSVFHWRDDEGRKKSRELDNDYTIIRIPAGTPHALSNPGPGPVFLVAFRTDSPDPSLPAAEPAVIL